VLDEALKVWVGTNLAGSKCDYCDQDADTPTAANIAELVQYVLLCIEQEWTEADHPSPKGDEAGELLLEHQENTVLLVEDLGIAKRGTQLFEDIVAALPERSWCRIDPLNATPHEGSSASWRHFCDIIKHQRRFFFRGDGTDRLHDDESHEADRDISKLLADLSDYCERAGLHRVKSAGAQYSRCRLKIGEAPFGPRQMGPPPMRLANQANRMSPAGIPMFYGAASELTALAETASEPGRFAVATFRTTRDLNLLDLRKIPAVPSLFDLGRAAERPWARFIRDFLEDFTKPIERDGKEHVEYVPTQVVTEYFRTMIRINGKSVDGILYGSAKRNGATAVVLFADMHSVVEQALPNSERYETAAESPDHDPPWLEMTAYREVQFDPASNAVMPCT
jgi:hypothetical protein